MRGMPCLFCANKWVLLSHDLNELCIREIPKDFVRKRALRMRLHVGPTRGFLVRGNFVRSLNKFKGFTVELRLTATSVIRSPRYNGQFFLTRRKGHTISFKKKPSLIRSPVNTANGHILKSQTVQSLMFSPR